MAHPDLHILILAAGGSSRMGPRDKLLEPVDGMPLLRRQARMALRAAVGPVWVVVPRGPHPRIDALAGLDVRIIEVADAAEGMNASLRAGIAALADTARAAMVLLADLPDLKEADLKKVHQAVDLKSENKIWRGATQDGEPGHPIVFVASLFPALARLTGDGGGREVVAAARDQTVLIPLPGTRARDDLDTPEAWALWRAANPTR